MSAAGVAALAAVIVPVCGFLWFIAYTHPDSFVGFSKLIERATSFVFFVTLTWNCSNLAAEFAILNSSLDHKLAQIAGRAVFVLLIPWGIPLGACALGLYIIFLQTLPIWLLKSSPKR